VTVPSAIEIQWEAPAACPDAAAVRASIERLLGKKLSEVEVTALVASGRVEPGDAGKWQLQAELVVGERIEKETLVANQCGALSDAMALKVALAIDPVAVVEAVRPPAAEPLTPSPQPAAQPLQPTPRFVREPLRVGARLLGQVGGGPLPGANPGVGAFVSVDWQRARIELGGNAFWGGVARYDELPEVGADLQLFTGALRGCFTPGGGHWRFPICAGPELGVMRGSGFGVETSEVTSGLWGGVVAGLAAEWRMARRLSLWVELGAVLTLLKPEFHMQNLPTLYRPDSAGARFATGLETHF
jgi:hypothetical protein